MGEAEEIITILEEPVEETMVRVEAEASVPMRVHSPAMDCIQASGAYRYRLVAILQVQIIGSLWAVEVVPARETTMWECMVPTAEELYSS
jgi:hypothetical protein